jgi:hypothetical protein
LVVLENQFAEISGLLAPLHQTPFRRTCAGTRSPTSVTLETFYSSKSIGLYKGFD